MAVVFTLLLLASLILLVIGVISPKTALFWKKNGSVSRKHAALVYTAAFLLSFIGLAIFVPAKVTDASANKDSDDSTPSSENKEQINNFANTTWYSQELQYSWKVDVPNNIILKFSADSVEFDLPGGDGLLASDLLKTRSATTPKHFTVSYSLKDNEIILDPGFTGYNIHMEISGDSLIWKGGRPVSRDYISLKKTGPVIRLK